MSEFPCPAGVSEATWEILLLEARLANNLARFMLEHGTIFDSVRVAEQRGPLRQCFFNAGQLALSDASENLWYCEGLAASQNLPFATPHAWLVDATGSAIEVTWETPGRFYLGCVFTHHGLQDALNATKVGGVFGYNTPAWVLATPGRWKAPKYPGLGLIIN